MLQITLLKYRSIGFNVNMLTHHALATFLELHMVS